MVLEGLKQIILRKQKWLVIPNNPKKNLCVLQNGIDFPFFIIMVLKPWIIITNGKMYNTMDPLGCPTLTKSHQLNLIWVLIGCHRDRCKSICFRVILNHDISLLPSISSVCLYKWIKNRKMKGKNKYLLEAYYFKINTFNSISIYLHIYIYISYTPV